MRLGEELLAIRCEQHLLLAFVRNAHGENTRPGLELLHSLDYAYGHRREACDIVVSGGLGCSIVPFRLGVPPEIVLVTLGNPPALASAAISV